MPPSWSSIIACALSSSSARNANTAFPPMHATYVFIGEFLLGGKRRLGAGVSHALRKCHELLVRQVKSLPELRTVDRSAKHGSEPFGGAEQIDVLSDKAGIDAGVKTALLGSNVRHALAMGDIDEVQGCGCDKILKTRLRAKIFLHVWQQLVGLRLIKPYAIGHRQIDINHHDMAPIGNSPTIARRAIDAEGRPQ